MLIKCNQTRTRTRTRTTSRKISTTNPEVHPLMWNSCRGPARVPKQARWGMGEKGRYESGRFGANIFLKGDGFFLLVVKRDGFRNVPFHAPQNRPLSSVVESGSPKPATSAKQQQQTPDSKLLIEGVCTFSPPPSLASKPAGQLCLPCVKPRGRLWSTLGSTLG